MTYRVELRHRPRKHLAVVKFESTIPEMSRNIGKAFSDVAEYLNRNGAEIQAPAVAYYEPAGNGFRISAGFPVIAPVPGDGHVVPAELPESDVAATTHVGPYDQLPTAYSALQSWMTEHHRQPADGDVMWEEYWSPPTAPPAEMRTDVYWPLKS